MTNEIIDFRDFLGIDENDSARVYSDEKDKINPEQIFDIGMEETISYRRQYSTRELSEILRVDLENMTYEEALKCIMTNKSKKIEESLRAERLVNRVSWSVLPKEAMKTWPRSIVINSRTLGGPIHDAQLKAIIESGDQDMLEKFIGIELGTNTTSEDDLLRYGRTIKGKAKDDDENTVGKLLE